MANRFGGVSAAESYAIKVRWLVGGLVSVIVVLAAAFLVVVNNHKRSIPSIKDESTSNEDPSRSGKAEILVALNRLESGVPLSVGSFQTVLMDESQVPMGALRKKDMPKVLEKYSSRLIQPNVPIILQDITDKQPLSSLPIPPGYRGVTIEVDRREGVEWFVRPNSRVDVLWAFSKDGTQQLATVVRYAKVLSVAGATAQHAASSGSAPGEPQGRTTVTLLTLERDAKKIELARSYGRLSLSLVGETDEMTEEKDPDVVDVTDILNPNSNREKVAPAEEEQPQGTIYATHPQTGKTVRYVLSKNSGKWRLDSNY